MPVVTPKEASSLACRTAPAGHSSLTRLVVDSMRVCRPVLLGIVFNHERNFELVQPVWRDSNADVATGDEKASAGSSFSKHRRPSSDFLHDRSFLRHNEKTHLECRMIHAIRSVVHLHAAMMRSPSFSLSRSSTTTTHSPAAMAARASSMLSSSSSTAAPLIFVAVEVDTSCDMSVPFMLQSGRKKIEKLHASSG